MTVFEHMIVEAYTGVERDLAKLKVAEVKKMEDLIPLCSDSVTRKAFLTVYNLFPKIESLPEEEKKELKEWVIKNFTGKPISELIENCKIVYTAGKIIE